MSGIMHSLHSILGQSHLDEPADELGAVEHSAIHTNTPPEKKDNLLRMLLENRDCLVKLKQLVLYKH